MATIETWKRYQRTWSCDAATRRELFESTLAADCRYTDPLAATAGWDELGAYIDQFQTQVPGGAFVTKRFRTHHQTSIAEWNMVDAGGDVIGDGVSFARYGEDGKLVEMIGFFEVPPA